MTKCWGSLGACCLTDTPRGLQPHGFSAHRPSHCRDSPKAQVALSLGILSQTPADPSNPVWYAIHPATATATATVTPTATATLQPTPTPNNPYSFQNATLVLNDPLLDNSQGNQWSLSTVPQANCQFGVAGLHCAAIVPTL
jgi:hypothetical protein